MSVFYLMYFLNGCIGISEPNFDRLPAIFPNIHILVNVLINIILYLLDYMSLYCVNLPLYLSKFNVFIYHFILKGVRLRASPPLFSSFIVYKYIFYKIILFIINT